MSFALTLRAKSVSHLAGRTVMIAQRFGLGDQRMRRNLARYVDIATSAGATLTLPITASVLARHPDVIREIADRVELAIHGLVHSDHAALSFDEQCDGITKAMALFATHGFAFSGFRGPYLRSNDLTHDALRRFHFSYDCSQSYLFPVLGDQLGWDERPRSMQRALDLYGARLATEAAVRPRERDGLVDIPVALPDDEIMVDRLGLCASSQARAWGTVFDWTHARGELFVLQLHPERIEHSAEALQYVLHRARAASPAVWFARLDEIATWWRRRATARIEIISLAGAYRCVLMRADPDVGLLVKNVDDRGTDGWPRGERPSRSPMVEYRGPLPVVRLSARTAPRVRAFLEEEGYIVASDDEPAEGSTVVDAPEPWTEQAVLAQIEASAAPLVRVGRWPLGFASALAVTGDIDSITLGDFFWRVWETWR